MTNLDRYYSNGHIDDISKQYSFLMCPDDITNDPLDCHPACPIGVSCEDCWRRFLEHDDCDNYIDDDFWSNMLNKLIAEGN